MTELTEDIKLVKIHLEKARDENTRMGLYRLIELLEAWRKK